VRPLTRFLTAGIISTTCLGVGGERIEAKERIYYLIPTLIDEFQTESQRMIEGIFGALNYDVISADADGDPDLQARQLRSAVADSPGAIILNAVDSFSIGRTLREIRTTHTPVLVYDRMLPLEYDFDFASISDAESIGRLGASKVIEILQAARNDQIHKTILQIVGDPGDSYSLRVLQGFRTALKDYNNARVITVPAIGWEPANARKATEEILKTTPNIDLIFCHSADLAAAVIPLVAERIKQGVIKVAAITGAPMGLENLKNELQVFEIEQPLYAQAYGLALGLLHIKKRDSARGVALSDGRCDMLGARGNLVEHGRVLQFQGKLITAGDLANRGQLGLWGDLTRPVKSADEIKNLECDGR
jgi:ribose transport system substrate-binding protein